MEGDKTELDILITIRDMNDEESGVDDILLGCALRKDDLPAFLRDVAALARSYDGKNFSELAESADDSAIIAARRRWFADAARDVVDRAQAVLDDSSRP